LGSAVIAQRLNCKGTPKCSSYCKEKWGVPLKCVITCVIIGVRYTFYVVYLTIVQYTLLNETNIFMPSGLVLGPYRTQFRACCWTNVRVDAVSMLSLHCFYFKFSVSKKYLFYEPHCLVKEICRLIFLPISMHWVTYWYFNDVEKSGYLQ
jgi:hypothetical protein